ncbi:MAG TPA: hypothetical protein VHQ67_02485 [Nitrospiraceae bacterium]|nr:hypothetical protein [Nitrospiraceae bacterium]
MSTARAHRWSAVILIGLTINAVQILLQPGEAHSGLMAASGRPLLLPDDRIVIGTVQHVRSGVVQVNIAELEPLFLSLESAAEKGISPIKPGDKLKIVISGENEPIDFQPADQPGWDRVLKGHLIQPLMGDQRWALVRTAQDMNEPYEVAEVARHKVLNIPVGVPAMFLLDKGNVIIDATFGSEHALLGTLAKWSQDRRMIPR